MGYKNEIEAAILGVLREGSMHGYKISQEIRERSEGLLKTGDNQIYPALKALELGGCITAEWVLQEGKPARKVYSLSEVGRGRLVELREEWKRYSLHLSGLIGPEPA